MLDQITMDLVGYRVRTADGMPVGEIDAVGPRGLRLHKMAGQGMMRHGYVPAEAVAGVDRDTDVVVLEPGIAMDSITAAPAPPGGDTGAWRESDDWWADLLGHYGLYDAGGKGAGPFLHPGGR